MTTDRNTGIKTALYILSQHNLSQVSSIKELVKELPISPYIQYGSHNKNMFMYAAAKGDTAKLQTYLEYIPKDTYKKIVNRKDNRGITALAYAAKNGHAGCVTILLNAKADPNIADNDGYTSLMEASQRGHEDVVKLLCDNGANVNTKRADGFTSLMEASQEGHANVVNVLCRHEANVNAAMTDGYTSLMWAAQNGHVNVVEVLCRYEANVNATTTDTGETPLILASVMGHLEVARKLCKSGANVNAAQKDGKTALMLAVKNNHANIVKLLNEYESIPKSGGYKQTRRVNRIKKRLSRRRRYR